MQKENHRNQNITMSVQKFDDQDPEKCQKLTNLPCSDAETLKKYYQSDLLSIYIESGKKLPNPSQLLQKIIFREKKFKEVHDLYSQLKYKQKKFSMPLQKTQNKDIKLILEKNLNIENEEKRQYQNFVEIKVQNLLNFLRINKIDQSQILKAVENDTQNIFQLFFNSLQNELNTFKQSKNQMNENNNESQIKIYQTFSFSQYQAFQRLKNQSKQKDNALQMITKQNQLLKEKINQLSKHFVHQLKPTKPLKQQQEKFYLTEIKEKDMCLEKNKVQILNLKQKISEKQKLLLLKEKQLNNNTNLSNRQKLFEKQIKQLKQKITNDGLTHKKQKQILLDKIINLGQNKMSKFSSSHSRSKSIARRMTLGQKMKKSQQYEEIKSSIIEEERKRIGDIAQFWRNYVEKVVCEMSTQIEKKQSIIRMKNEEIEKLRFKPKQRNQ